MPVHGSPGRHCSRTQGSMWVTTTEIQRVCLVPESGLHIEHARYIIASRLTTSPVRVAGALARCLLPSFHQASPA